MTGAGGVGAGGLGVASGAGAALPLWVDCDVALGAASGDVDDGFALAACALAGSASLLGVSTVFGNTAADTAQGCAQRLLGALGRQVPVLRGAPRAGAVAPQVVQALLDLPIGAHLLCLGPLTNIAAALRADPTLAARVTMWLVGGNLTSRGPLPPWWPFEFNLALDADAARVVFSAGGCGAASRILFPLPVCRRLRVDAAALWRLHETSEAGRYLARHSLRWLLRSPLRYGALSFPVWDLVPVLAALGLLPVRCGERRLIVHGRGGVREAACALPTSCAEDFDPAAAWAAFLSLCQPARAAGRACPAPPAAAPR